MPNTDRAGQLESSSYIQPCTCDNEKKNRIDLMSKEGWEIKHIPERVIDEVSDLEQFLESQLAI